LFIKSKLSDLLRLLSKVVKLQICHFETRAILLLVIVVVKYLWWFWLLNLCYSHIAVTILCYLPLSFLWAKIFVITLACRYFQKFTRVSVVSTFSISYEMRGGTCSCSMFSNWCFSNIQLETGTFCANTLAGTPGVMWLEVLCWYWRSPHVFLILNSVLGLQSSPC